jgi:hypothetical protein
LFADHHEQHDAQKRPSADKHFPIGKTLLQNKGKHRDHPGERQTKECAFQNDFATEAQIIAL